MAALPVLTGTKAQIILGGQVRAAFVRAWNRFLPQQARGLAHIAVTHGAEYAREQRAARDAYLTAALGQGDGAWWMARRGECALSGDWTVTP